MKRRAVSAGAISRELYAGIGIAACGDITVALAYRAPAAKGCASEGVLSKCVFGAGEASDALPAHLADLAPRAVYVDAGAATSVSCVDPIAERILGLVAAPSRVVTRSELRSGCERLLAQTKPHPHRGDLLMVAHRMFWRDWNTAEQANQYAVALFLAIYALRVYGA